MALGDILKEQAKKQPRETAIIFSDRRITYGELYEKSLDFACGLRQLGVIPGKRVAILLPNCPEYIFSYFASFLIGAVAVPINTYLAPGEVNYILNDSGAFVLITGQENYQTLCRKRSLPDSVRHVIVTPKNLYGCTSFKEVLEKGERKRRDPDFKDDSAQAVIIYTSGTTGHPKGAVLSHANLLANVEASAQAFPLNGKDRFLVFLPLFHSFTLTVSTLVPLYKGSKIILLPAIMRNLIREAMKKHRPSIMVGVPAVYHMLASASVPLLKRWLNPLRVCICGGAPLPEELHKKFEDKYRRPLLEGYGLSEAGPVVSLNPVKKRVLSSVGKPLPGIKVKVVDEQGGALPAGQVGELAVQGPNVMQGYWHNEIATREVIKDGWLHTGDLVKVDEEGYIYIMGRKKELIIVKGMNVYPREVEEVLYRHPAVAEAAVYGLPDDSRGEKPQAAVVLRETPGATPEELKEFCRQHLAAYKVPHHIELLSQLPKTGSGKIAKRRLQAQSLN